MTLVVVVAPPGLCSGLLDALQDLSALGLVSPFVWVPASEVPNGDIPAVAVAAGRRRGTTVQDALVTGRHTRVRLCMLASLVDGSAVPEAMEQSMASLLTETGGGARVERLRCVITRGGAGGHDVLAQEGWHNVLLAPEDSSGPARPRRLLGETTDPLEVARHAAPALAGVLGLWDGVAEAPLDDQDPLPGRTVRQARAFYRRLDAAAVAADLRARVTDTRAGVPLPREHGQVAEHVEDVPLATAEMARALWDKHAWVLGGARVQPRQEEIKPIGAWTALRMLFGFLGAALRRAPGQWYAAVMNRAASGIASSVHSLVFGTERAAYEVVVKGMTPGGQPAGWRDFAVAANALDAALTPASEREHEPAARLGALWQDYAGAAMTLLDAGTRDPLLAPVQVGSARGILPRPADSVPGTAAEFDALSGYVAATAGVGGPLPAVDVLGADALRQRLDVLVADHTAALEAERARQALRRWQSDHASSFGVRVGTTLGTRVVEVTREIRQLVTAIASLAEADVPDQASQGRQQRLARWLRIVFYTALVGLVVLAAVAVAVPIAFLDAFWLGTGVVALWFVITFVLFVRQQREVFRELSRRRAAGSQMEATRDNLRTALRDHRRLTAAYGQFLRWSEVVGAFLEEPFGRARASTDDGDVDGVRGLPLAAQVGVAVPDRATLAEVAALIRRDVFVTGWLTGPFEAMLADAPDRLGPEALEVTRSAESVFALGTGSSAALLDRWVQLIRDDGVGTASGDALWHGVVRGLQSDGRELADRLLDQVRSSGSPHPVELAEFMARVDDTGEHAPRGSFDPAVLSLEGRAKDGSAVVAPFGARASSGLGTTAVLVQLGQGRPVFDFAGPADAPHVEWTPSVDSPFTDQGWA